MRFQPGLAAPDQGAPARAPRRTTRRAGVAGPSGRSSVALGFHQTEGSSFVPASEAGSGLERPPQRAEPIGQQVFRPGPESPVVFGDRLAF
jgi:hypothetical protein